jgi:hypothetical protein
MFAGSGYGVTADPRRSLLKSLLKDWAAVKMVGPGAPCGSKGTMYEERMGDIVGKDEYVRRGREETVIGKGLTAGSSPPYQ